MVDILYPYCIAAYFVSKIQVAKFLVLNPLCFSISPLAKTVKVYHDSCHQGHDFQLESLNTPKCILVVAVRSDLSGRLSYPRHPAAIGRQIRDHKQGFGIHKGAWGGGGWKRQREKENKSRWEAGEGYYANYTACDKFKKIIIIYFLPTVLTFNGHTFQWCLSGAILVIVVVAGLQTHVHTFVFALEESEAVVSRTTIHATL